MDEKRVAIIGAGVCGLLCAKYSLENGLRPIVFEKSNKSGGLWVSNGTAIWEGMRANVNKYVTTISDHPWPPGTNVYPFTHQVREYLRSYSERFKLEEHIRFNHKVEFARRLEDQSWEIKFTNLVTNRPETEKFDFLIMASGLFSIPRLPSDLNRDVFKGVVKHSCQFRLNDPDFKSKRVIVVGGCISGISLTDQLVDHASHVIHLYRRTPLIITRLWKLKLDQPNLYSIQPGESISNTRASAYSNKTIEEKKRDQRSFLKRVFPFQTTKNSTCPKDLFVDLDDMDSELISGSSDTYIDFVKDGKIQPVKSEIDRFDEKGVYLKNGAYFEVDAVLYCTGYKLSIDYLEHAAKEAMRLREDKPKFSMLLYKNTFVPGWETMAFTGQYARSYFTGYELQAKWVTAVFSGKIKLPNRDVMDAFVKNLEERRDKDKGAQFPYGPYLLITDQIAQELGLLPDLKTIKETQPELYDYLWNDLVTWSHYLFDKQNKEYFWDMLKEVREIKTRVYEITGNEEDMRQSQVEEQFMRFYDY